MSCNVRLLAEVNREGRLPVPWHLIATVGHGTEGGPPAFSRTYKRAGISRQRRRDDCGAASIRPAPPARTEQTASQAPVPWWPAP